MARTPSSPPPMQAPAPMAQPVAPPPQVMQQSKPSLLEAIAAASAGFGDLVKDSKNDYLKSQYLALPGLLKAIKPALLEQGVVIYSQLVFVNGACVVRTTLSFADGGEELASDFPIPDLSSQQKIGAVVTYGTRYNLFALLAICPENDDDGNSGGYATNQPAQSLPGLPGAPASWPLPGQYAQPQPPAYQQAAPVPPVMAHPVQPLPVLQ